MKDMIEFRLERVRWFIDYKVLGVIVLERYKREIREGDEPRMILAERNSRGNRKYRYWSNVFLK